LARVRLRVNQADHSGVLRHPFLEAQQSALSIARRIFSGALETCRLVFGAVA
jgi:hypothetical protein